MTQAGVDAFDEGEHGVRLEGRETTGTSVGTFFKLNKCWS